MAKTYYPFDAGAGAVVNEAEWATMARLWRATGVIAGEANELEVSADGTDLTVDVDTGVAWVHGFYFASDAVETLDLAAADPFEDRLDRIVVRLDRAANTVDLAILEGTADPDPVAPSLTQDDVTWEVPLATVEVPANASAISGGNVDDAREIVALPRFLAGGVNPDEEAGVAWVRQVDGAYVPVDVATQTELENATLTSSANLTDTSVSATGTQEQWGSETLTLPQSEGVIAVVALLSGHARHLGSGVVRVRCRVQISVDGGSAWTSGRWQLVSVGPDLNLVGQTALLRTTPQTPPGDVRIRAQVEQVDGTAGDIDWRDGYLIGLMHI